MKNLYFPENEKPLSSIIRFAIPALIVGVLDALSFALLQVLLLNKFQPAISHAIKKSGFIFFPALAAAGLFGYGAAAFISIRLGAKDGIAAERAAMAALALSFGVALLYALLVYFGLDFIFSYVVISSKALVYAREYLSIACWSLPLTVAGAAMSYVILGQGSPWAASVALIIKPVSIFLFSLWFVSQPGWGAAGYAYAETAASALSAAWIVYYFASGRGSIKFSIKSLTPLLSISAKIIYYGLPLLVMAVSLRFMYSFTIGVLANESGCIGSLSNSRIVYIGSVLLIPVLALCKGTLPIFGYYYGAGSKDKLKETLTLAASYATAVCALAAGAIAIFAEQFVGWLYPASAEIIAESVRGIRIYYALLPLAGFQMVLAYYYLGTGRPIKSLTVSFLRQVFFLGAAQYLLARVYGLSGIWVANPVADALGACVAVAFFYFELKRLRTIAA